MSSGVSCQFFTPSCYVEYEGFNIDKLKHIYNEEKREDNNKEISLFRMQAIPTLLFHEKVGIIPIFRDRRPMTRKIIDDWIDHTSQMSYDRIEKDLNILKEFLLSCDDLFESEDDIPFAYAAMRFLLNERILWCTSNVKKLKTFLGI